MEHVSDTTPVELLEQSGFSFQKNPFNRRIQPGEVIDCVRDVKGLIAGTELYSEEVLKEARNLKVIARVGVGIDNVDHDYCRSRGITVTYTPEAPADGVAELAVANIINLARNIHQSDRSVRERAWNRIMGSLLRELKIGILGVGRIGSRVVKLLQPFNTNLYGCDLAPNEQFGKQHNLTWLPMDELFATCDLVTVHVPLTDQTRQFISTHELRSMKPGSFLINSSRGAVLDELVLVNALQDGHLGGAALDVFNTEPYEGPLASMDNVVLTAHLGSSAWASRIGMEYGAAEDCVRVLSGHQPLRPVPTENSTRQEQDQDQDQDQNGSFISNQSSASKPSIAN